MSQIVWVGSSFRFTAYSGPVQDYIDRVIAADVAAGNTQGLELATRNAYDVFITGCISDGTLGTSEGVLSQANSLIKAACCVAGARTPSGALTPFVGTAPTNFNFVAADYNRKTGLNPGGSGTKYLNSNRNNNADPQNNQHICLYSSGYTTNTQYLAGVVGGTNPGASSMGIFSGNAFFRSRNSGFDSIAGTFSGFLGMSRTSANSYTARLGAAQSTFTRSSQSTLAGDINIFRSGPGDGAFSNSPLSFYSIGEGLSLSLLRDRLDVLTAALADAIP